MATEEASEPVSMDDIRRDTLRAGAAFFLVGAGLAALALLLVILVVEPLAAPAILVIAVIALLMLVAGLTWGFGVGRRRVGARRIP